MLMPLSFRARALPALAVICLVACGVKPTPAVTDGGLADPAHDPCTQPGDKGNELKVGEYCTAGSSNCENNDIAAGQAFLCTLSQDPTAPLAFCTKACSLNTDCGTGAICQGDPTQPSGPKGCVPSKCSPGDPGTTSLPDAGPGDAGATTDGGTVTDAGSDAG